MGASTMSALTFYDILWEVYECDNARMIGNILKRLLIGHKGLAREEAVKVLAGQLPKEVEIEVGSLE